MPAKNDRAVDVVQPRVRSPRSLRLHAAMGAAAACIVGTWACSPSPSPPGPHTESGRGSRLVTSDADFGMLAASASDEPRRLSRDELSGVVRDMTPEEFAWLRSEKPNDPIGVPAQTEDERRADLLRQVESIPPDSEVRILVAALDTVREDWPSIARDVTAHGEEGATLLQARRDRVRDRLAPVAALARARGWEVDSDIWLATAVLLRIRADEVGALTAMAPLEFELTLDTDKGGVSYDGNLTRIHTRADVLINTGGYTGADGHGWGSPGTPSRLAIFEPNKSLAHDHFVFRVPPPSTAGRWAAFTECTGPSTCNLWAPTWDFSLMTYDAFGNLVPDHISRRHATAVSRVALGSIENGADPAHATSPARLARSGIASGARPYFYTGGWGAGIRIGFLQHATLTKNVDTMNWSYHDGTNCSNVLSPSLADFQAIYNAQQMGLLLTKAAGNDCPGGASCNSCTVTWPAFSRAGVTVGGVDTCNGATPYNAQPLYATSGRGGGDIWVSGAPYVGVVSLVDVVAPSCYDLLSIYNETTSLNDYSWSGVQGTSLSAPMVAGGVTLFGSWATAAGWAPTAQQRQAATILSGDGWSYSTGTKPTSGMDKRSGAGRYRAQSLGWPSNSGYWGWGCHSGDISAGQTISYEVGELRAQSRRRFKPGKRCSRGMNFASLTRRIST